MNDTVGKYVNVNFFMQFVVPKSSRTAADVTSISLHAAALFCSLIARYVAKSVHHEH